MDYKKLLLFFVAAALLTGCSDKKQDTISVDFDEPQVSVSVPDELNAEPVTKAEEQRKLPVLSIETVSQDKDVLDFVNEPVAKHVAESIASWTPGYEMPPEPYNEECRITLTDADGNVIFEPADAKVKVRGNWTTVYQKKPLKIKFNEKHSMLGLNDGAELKNWLLLAEYKDGSMLRDKAAFYAADRLLSEDELFSPDSEFVQVEINGEYYGVYLLTEMIQANSARVDITEPEKDYTGTDIGYLLEYDGYYTTEDEMHGFPLTLANDAPLRPYDGKGGGGEKIKCLKTSDLGMTIKSDIYSMEQHDFIENYVNNVYTIMYEAAYNDKAYSFDAEYENISENKDLTPQQAVESVVNVNSLADMYIISELTCDADIYWSSFFMDADLGAEGDKKLTFESPWDFDSSMGNKDRCIDGNGFYASNVVPDVDGWESNKVNPWLMVLAYEDWYQDIVKKKWTKAYNEGVFTDMIEMVRNDASQLQDEFEKNYKKWNNIVANYEFANELSKPAAKCKNQLDAANFLAEWLTKRVNFLNSQWYK